MTWIQDTSPGSSPSDIEQTIYQEEMGIKNNALSTEIGVDCSCKDETRYDVQGSTLKISKLLTNVMDAVYHYYGSPSGIYLFHPCNHIGFS